MTSLPCEDEQAVLTHGFDFRPAWWQRSTVSASWATKLNDLRPAAQGRDYHHVTRSDLLTRHRDGSPDASGSLLLACYVWGTGAEGWLVGRRARVFRDTPGEILGQRLVEAREILGTHGPAAAYKALHDGGPLRTKWMRASFFTKYLYAASAPGDRTCGPALILDQFVAIGLNDRHGWGLPENGPWSASTYERWLDHAHHEAEQGSKRTGAPVRPDAVEMAYFKHGRGIWRSRRPSRRRSRRKDGASLS